MKNLLTLLFLIPLLSFSQEDQFTVYEEQDSVRIEMFTPHNSPLVIDSLYYTFTPEIGYNRAKIFFSSNESGSNTHSFTSPIIFPPDCSIFVYRIIDGEPVMNGVSEFTPIHWCYLGIGTNQITSKSEFIATTYSVTGQLIKKEKTYTYETLKGIHIVHLKIGEHTKRIKTIR